MSEVGPLIPLGFAFGLLMLARIVFLLVLRSGENKRHTRPNSGDQPTVIENELFASTPNENTP